MPAVPRITILYYFCMGLGVGRVDRYILWVEIFICIDEMRDVFDIY